MPTLSRKKELVEQYLVYREHPHSFTYIKDEYSIFHEHGIKIDFPLRVFNLFGLGINRERFLKDLTPSFDWLPWDEYNVRHEQILFLSHCFPHETKKLRIFLKKYYAGEAGIQDLHHIIHRLTAGEKSDFERIQPYRRRTIAAFQIKKHTHSLWRIKRVPAKPLVQTGENDYRREARRFPEMSPTISNHHEFQKLLGCIADMVASIHKQPENLLVTAHQMGVSARHGRFGSNAPEGIHKDGVDYIISALVMERKAIRGGVSNVYGADKTTLFLSHTLEPGEGIFQSDSESPFWHDVTPVYLDTNSPEEEGERNIFGFDITIE